jgi:hypothetical protein
MLGALEGRRIRRGGSRDVVRCYRYAPVPIMTSAREQNSIESVALAFILSTLANIAATQDDGGYQCRSHAQSDCVRLGVSLYPRLEDDTRLVADRPKLCLCSYTLWDLWIDVGGPQ